MARLRPKGQELNLSTDHGGICLFYQSKFTVKDIALPSYKTMEVLAVYIQSTMLRLVFVVVYRPGSDTVTSSFLSDFADLLERVTILAVPLLISGDINMHLDDQKLSSTVTFDHLMHDFDPTQHISGPTQKSGRHTLDVLITRSQSSVTHSVCPPVLSDHSLISATMSAGPNVEVAPTVYSKELWSEFNIDTFRADFCWRPT
jgi:hypothetical protein